MTASFGVVPKIRKQQISDLLSQGKRLDGRGLTSYREIKIEVGLIDKALGSALVSLGNTKVLVGIKIEEGKPFPDTPEDGVQIVNAELVPLASPSFETGPPSEEAIELARVVDRGIRESKTIDTKKLCIIPGKNVFMVFIDIYVLDHDGNLFDASALAAISALLNAKMKEFVVKEDGELEFKENYIKLPITNCPVEITLAKIGTTMIVDPSLEEESVTDARITIAIDAEGRLCAIQKSLPGTMMPEEIIEAVQIAQVKAKEFRDTVLKGFINHE
ncbi:MAG: exosome complex protein Rrp42 [Candidatus Bathyarchaeota archaeon]